MITERQESILDKLIRDYIGLAEPVSSESLQKRHKFGLSPATLRIEMQKLTDGGYLLQPHTSAGRVPTDKGYRFFVDEILAEEFDSLENDFETDWRNIQEITRFLAEESSNLALGYLSEDRMLWKDGWTDIFHEPEFSETGFISRFAEILEDLEENIEEVVSPKVKIYIGGENPFSKIKDFSIISSGAFAILGPKRMDYNKNIKLLKNLNYGRKKNKK